MAAKPRVWVGDNTTCPIRWEWIGHGWISNPSDVTMYPGDIFMPHEDRECPRKPTIDVRELNTIQTCKVVDW